MPSSIPFIATSKTSSVHFSVSVIDRYIKPLLPLLYFPKFDIDISAKLNKWPRVPFGFVVLASI